MAYRRFLAILAILGLSSYLSVSLACTTAIVGPQASKSGKPMIWKQRDTDSPSNVIVFVPATDSSFAYSALFDHDDLDRRSPFGGQNSEGFAILNNMSYNIASSDYDTKNGRTMRLALESCSTVDEFEDFLMNLSPRYCAANFAVLDASGACAYIEAADSTVVRYDVPVDGWLVRTNYSFAGSEDGPSGYARYESAYELMTRHRGKFDPVFFIDKMGRSFYNDVLGYDASKKCRRRYVYDEDFIARTSTTASICIDGDVIWAAVGYTPGAMVVPFSVKDGNNIPSCIKPSDKLDGKCASNELADVLKAKMHPFPRDGAHKYIDFKVFRPIRRIIRKYEKECVSLFDEGKADPGSIDALFERFKNEVGH